MICPECKAEYREAFTRCADCDVELVSEVEAEDQLEEESANELLSVLESGDSSFLADVIALIEAEKIPYLLQSGTALGMDSFLKTDELEWRAVLYVPGSYEEKVDTMIQQVKSDRAKAPREDAD